MSTLIFHEPITLEKVTCAVCSGVCALNKVVLDHARSNGGGYTCPYCKTPWSWRETDDQRRIKDLEKKLAWEAGEVARQKNAKEYAEQALKTTQASLVTTKGVVTKIRKRVANATCPCCNRHFPNDKMAKHIAVKHPEFKKHPE